ncbi:MAG TPA: hypothetical protein VHS31_12320 [Tepidisphaeraceae bacterium]|jgi:nucleoid DNA-binding protein|nr:hypothetical protein [Tepidisphaeraceae bacterium]
MNRRALFLSAASVITAGLLSRFAAAADYAGNYDGTGIAVVITPNGANFEGEIRKGDQKFPLTAHEDGDHLSGVFTAGGNAFNFTATHQGDDLTLVTDGATYQLHRGAAAAVATPAPAADALANYVVLNSTDVGRSLVREIPNATSTQDALMATFPDLARYFGGRPKILGAYEDQRDHKSAFVSFSTQLNGQTLKGFVTTKLRDRGAVVFVVFGKADATRAQWAALTAQPTPAAGVAEPDIKTQMAAVPLQPYSFPDRTGAIGIAQGWTTQAQTESNLLITGPANQKIRMAFGGTMYTPNNPMTRQAGLNMAVAPYNADPATTLGNIIHANSAVSQRRGGPTSVPDKVIKVVSVPGRMQGGRGAQITYDVTITDQNGPKPMRVLIQFEYTPVVNGTWGYYVSLQLIAPRDTFEKDLPVMLAQAFSLSENADAVAAKSRREIDAANAHAKAMQAANQKIADAHYANTESVERNEQIKMRSLTDFDETIRGERTIEDTQTGEQTSVNLADVHNIVDKLNYQDPDRYREIPLRDKFYPIPGGENQPDYIPR